MTVANIRLSGREYVLIRKRDFSRLMKHESLYRRMQSEDESLVALAAKRLKAFDRAGGKGVSLAQVKKELGL